MQNSNEIIIVELSAFKRRIIIIDDDPGVRDIFGIIFEREGYTIELKSSGDELLESNFTAPDLFFIDKQLAGANGLDICRHLKKQESTKHIPVIMISASPDIAALSKEAGADDYMEKPFEMARLLKMADHYSNKKDPQS